VIADTNIVIHLIDDFLKSDSQSELQRYAAEQRLIVNEIIYAEISGQYESAEAVTDLLEALRMRTVRLTLDECFRAGVAFRDYRRNGGPRTTILPDFLIGAQASVRGWSILTRDTKRFSTYFPEVELINPMQAQND
jgi:predicted nucleic acid-binding protein